MTTRFSGLSPVFSAGILVLLALLTGITLLARVPRPASEALSGGAKAASIVGMSDVRHYRMVVDEVAAGRGYYEASARLQREHGFPLKPFFTVRLPTLAILSAYLGPLGMQVAGVGLLTALMLVWMTRLTELGFEPKMRVAVLVALALCSSGPCSPINGAFHESWAGVLVALSLGLWRPGRYLAAVAIGVAACLFRELALIYLGIMMMAALSEQRWREAVSWGAAIGAMAIVLGFHAQAVAVVVLPGDLVSQGWNGRQGWIFYLFSITETTLLHTLPESLSYTIVVLSLFGWAAWRSEYGLRVPALLMVFAFLVMVFARAELFYWSLMTAPFALMGLAFAPGALRDLAVQAAPLVRSLFPAASEVRG